MVLDVVARNKNATYNFSTTYRCYFDFKEWMVEAVLGQDDARKHRQNEFLLTIQKRFVGNQEMLEEYRVAGVKPLKMNKTNASLDLFIEHSSCNGEFTRDECIRLYTLFRVHKAAFHKAVRGSSEKKDLMCMYTHFLKAFDVGSELGGKIEYC